MPKNKTEAPNIKNAKKQLGKEIAKCRSRDRSLRNLANSIGLSPSNMKYIEDGVNAPSPECYEKLIKELQPLPDQRKRMDKLYVSIRNAPPLDVCKIINSNENFLDALRLLHDTAISNEQLEEVKVLFASFVCDS